MKNTIKNLVHDILNQSVFINNYNIDKLDLDQNNAYCSIKYQEKNVLLSTKLQEEIKTNINRVYPHIKVYIYFTKITNITHSKQTVFNVKKIIAVASGKGGVGKSTITTNLAYSLHMLGYKVGVLDADLYGPSIDFMLKGKLSDGYNINYPIEPYIKNHISYNSISNFMKNKDDPVLLKAPMIIKVFKQMLLETNWDNVDYLLIDFPPGTGDLHMYFTHNFNNVSVVIVCTSQKLAIIDAIKSINMYHKNNTNILGIIENMSSFICAKCNTIHHIFDTSKIQNVAQTHNINYLGDIPIDISLRIASDNQVNLIESEPNKPISKIFINIAQSISSSCSTK